MGSWFEHVEDIVAQNQKEIEQQRMKVCFNLPATVANTPHREPLIQLCPMPDNSLLLVGQDGLISTWTQDLKLKKNRLILDENKNQIRKMKWVSDSTVMIQFKKLVIATSDREIRIYELSNNFEPYCQIVGFETIPLHMGFSTRNKDEGLIYFGDEQGCVNIIVADHMAEALRKWSKCPMVDETPTVSVQDIVNPDHVQFIRWKVHNDWVTQIKYIPSMQSIISCSNDDYTALVVGCVEESKNVQMQLKDIFEQSSMKSKRTIVTGNVPPKRNSWDEKLFRVRRGVKTFDYSNESNIIVTGGLDRIVRLWNPYLPEWAIGVMHGHSSPIVYVRIGDENSKIYSVSEHCAVMVWDIENRTCLTRVIPQAIPIRGQLATCFLSLHQRTLFMASETLAALQVQQIAKQPYHLSTTHSEPVTSCQYNGQYKQVVSCSEGSAIKIWDIRTGQLLFELKGAHGNSAISCLALDKTCSRMLTGGRDGSLNKWLYGEKNIKFIGTVKKANPEEEINDCTYAVLHDKWYILYVGWDRYVHFIPESMDAVDSANLPPRRKSKGHTEEILCVASWPDNFVATSSFDGEVILWNLISGKMFWRLKPPNDENLERRTDDLIINRVIFLYTRLEQKKESAILVASGPRGQITFWNIFGGGKIFGRFPGSHYNSVVKDMTLSEDETLLCAADQLYYVYIWQIKQYALHGPEEKPPALLSCWRAHTSDITRVIPLSFDRLVITSSLDCTVKLWSLSGSHIGTFGQNLPWNVLEKETWKQQGCDNSTTTPGLLSVETTGTKPNPSSAENNAGITAELTGSSQSTDDNDILEELKKIHILKSENRVRIIGPKKVEIQQTCGRLNAYKSLKIADLINPPYNIQKPNPAAELNDQFDLSF